MSAHRAGGYHVRVAGKEQVPLWKLFLGFLAFMGVVVSAARAPTIWLKLLVLMAGLAVLGVAAWLWGYDSREKSDWPKRR